MIEWVIQGAQTAKNLDLLILATDDERIAQVGRRLNLTVEMTAPDLPSGTDRVYQAVRQSSRVALDSDDIIVNIQGDEPLIEGPVLDELVQAFSEPAVQMATLGSPFTSEEEWLRPDVVKAIVGRDGRALYFTRALAPYTRLPFSAAGTGVLRHVGLYAYRAAALEAICSAAQDPLERAEGLEQLRALSMGIRMRVVTTQHLSWGVDSPSDVDRIEAFLTQRSQRPGPA
jgi:3-deoxy-manno-octulosonate cytidylyltransferase (CMP-KDO synthetase)